MNEGWRSNPELIFHVYVENTKQFQKPYDTYQHWSCFIVDSGAFEYRMEDKNGKAAAGDMVFCRPGTTFYRTTRGLSFHFIGFDWKHGQIPPPDLIPANGKITILNNRRMSSTLSLLRETTSLQSEAGLNYKKHLFRDLWQLFAMEAANLMESVLISEDPFVQRAVHLLQEHVDSGAALKQVAQQLGISQVQLTRMFKKEFHLTPSKYMTKQRMERVAHLLVHTRLTLADIAERCGFTDEHHLSKSFKSVMGMNPSVYRKAHMV